MVALKLGIGLGLSQRLSGNARAVTRAARVLAAGVRKLPAGLAPAHRAMELANEDATMQMEINSPRLRRCDYAQGNLVAVLAGDGHGSRPIGEHGCGERAFARFGECHIGVERDSVECGHAFRQ